MNAISATPALISVHGLTKRFGSFTAVDAINFDVQQNKIYGLLGRNGAGKTTVMQLLTGQQFATSGSARVFGEAPAENARVLERICFIKESQKYPDDFTVRHVMKSAPWFFSNWDAEFADRLLTDFRVPRTRRMKKLSRGQLSAVGVIVGLASRAPLTFFDEPYLGLDAVARQIFYDRLLEDYSAHSRTVILSTHLIDEVAKLLEHILVIDDGRIIIDSDADSLRGAAVTVSGRHAEVDTFIASRTVLHRQNVGGFTSVTIGGPLGREDRASAMRAGLDLGPVSLQQLIVARTTASEHDFSQSA